MAKKVVATTQTAQTWVVSDNDPQVQVFFAKDSIGVKVARITPKKSESGAATLLTYTKPWIEFTVPGLPEDEVVVGKVSFMIAKRRKRKTDSDVPASGSDIPF